ncbi:MAG TPA: PEPxxWA-CTERM sorting domain-containing protein [Caulobacteraceae bacterium]|nr:PEPxxWA-CTERM sorting domain-containing protein [Caulobacteraceae bacterium]
MPYPRGTRYSEGQTGTSYIGGSFSFGGTGLGVGDGYATFTSDTPEPSTWALMIGGFGLVGYMLRRRLRATRSLAA